MKDNNKTDPTIGCVLEKRSIYYTTILSHVISTDGKHMICGLKSGKLALFHLYDIIRQNIDFDTNSVEAQNYESFQPLRRPQQMVTTSSPVYSVATIGSRSQFVCGEKGQLQGWLLEDNKLTKEWTINLATNDCMANAIVATDEMVFTGCGDNNVYGFDVESHKQTVRLSEHKDYVNCVLLSKDSQLLYSAGEDGSVLVWDLRATKKSVAQICPHQTSELSRPNSGKWIGAMTLASDNWLVCGGGPHLSLWHLSSMSYASRFETDITSNVVQTHSDYIISGGNASNLQVWELNGELKSLIPTSANNVFSIGAFEYKDNEMGIEQLVSAAGMSYKIDISTQCKYKDFELIVY